MSSEKTATGSSSATLEMYRRIKEETERRAIEARERKQLSEAQSTVKSLCSRYAAMRQNLDSQRTDLPDLDYVIDEMPSPPLGDEVQDWGAYAARLGRQVDDWESAIESAIGRAKGAKLRRERTQRAWAQNLALRDSAQQHSADLAMLANAMEESILKVTLGQSLDPNARYEDVEAVNQDLATKLSRLTDEIARLKALAEANGNLRGVVARLVERSALVESEQTLAHWREFTLTSGLQRFEDELRQILTSLKLVEAELPVSTKCLIGDVRLGHLAPTGIDIWARISTFARKKADRASAHCLLSNPPFMEDDDLLDRWGALVTQLDHIANGFQELTPAVHRAYDALALEADTRMKQRHMRLAIAAALAESGFTSVDRTDIHFDDPQVDQVLLALPGYAEQFVLVRMHGNDFHWIPFRTDDRADTIAAIRDEEFDTDACEGLHRALARIGEQTGSSLSFKIHEHSTVDEHPVQPASAMQEVGVRINSREHAGQNQRQAQRDLGE